MDLLHIVLRVIHIGAGIFWVGAAAFLLFFVEPTVRALGPQGGAFMGHLSQVRKVPTAIGVSATLTVVAGVWLYWRDTNGFQLDVITTSVGLGFTVGAVAAIIAYVVGFGVVRPLVEKMGSLAAEMASGTPSPEQAAEMAGIQRRLHTTSVVNMALLVVAVIAMAAARYL